MKRIKPLYLILAGLFLLAYEAFYLNIPHNSQTRIIPQLSVAQAVAILCIAVALMISGLLKLIIERKRK